MASGAVDVAQSWQDAVVLLQNEGYQEIGFQRAAKETTSTFASAASSTSRTGRARKTRPMTSSTPGSPPPPPRAFWTPSDTAIPPAPPWRRSRTNRRSRTILSPIDAPILAQTPNDRAQREKQLAGFERSRQASDLPSRPARQCAGPKKQARGPTRPAPSFHAQISPEGVNRPLGVGRSWGFPCFPARIRHATLTLPHAPLIFLLLPPRYSS